MTATGPRVPPPPTARLPGAALDQDTVESYLRSVGVLAPDAIVLSAEPLGGGVSADVIAVETTSGSWVVKRALARLRVAGTWTATQRRAITEARAMQVAAELLPGVVPALMFVDPAEFIIVQERAPRSLADWRAELLAGPSPRDSDTARALGEALARLHNGTAGRPGLAGDFGDLTALTELRIDPFYRTAAAALPAAAARLDELAAQLLEQRCLVHGDFSPKNILADGAQVRVLDWEVAHLGNPVFDVALLLAHLVCKAVHRPAIAGSYAMCGREFHASYSRSVDATLRTDDRGLAAQVAALVLARTDGKSPAAYLTEDQAAAARHHALNWLSDPTVRTADIWRQLL